MKRLLELPAVEDLERKGKSIKGLRLKYEKIANEISKFARMKYSEGDYKDSYDKHNQATKLLKT